MSPVQVRSSPFEDDTAIWKHLSEFWFLAIPDRRVVC